MIIPVLLWIAFRFRNPGAAIALVLFAAIAIAGTAHGFALFPSSGAPLSMLYLQGYICIIAVISLGIVAVLEERDDSVLRLEAFTEELEGKVAARTQKLERVNQELTDAVSIVAHDVRGPVSSIRTLVHHMRWAPQDLSLAETDMLLGEVERTSANAVETMSRLLDLQWANDRPAVLVAADVGDLVATTCRPFEKLAAEKSITLRVGLRSFSRLRRVDSDAIEFIVSNLVSNAIKFLSAGGTVEVDVMEWGDDCRLVVSDDGPGIALGELPGIFQRFTRATNRPTRGESTTGIGLFIVRKLVLTLGGTLYVESERGAGSTFIVEWPAKPVLKMPQP
jgi:signal transduction histidine kinase